MKGLFLDEYLSFLEEQCSWRLAEDVSAAIGGTVFLWTSDYPAHLLDRLIDAAARLSGESREQLARRYGRHLFRLLHRRFPELVVVPRDCFAFLAQLPVRLALKLGVWLEDGHVPGITVLREGERLIVRVSVAVENIPSIMTGFLAAAAEHFGGVVLAGVREEGGGHAVAVLERHEVGGDHPRRVVPMRTPLPL